jgi:hypothetical protein
MFEWSGVLDSLGWAWDQSPLLLGFLGGPIKGIGKVAGKLAPVASFIPGVGPVAAAAMGAGGKLLSGGGVKDAAGAAAGAAGGGGGNSTWDTIGKIGSIAGGIFDASQDDKRTNADIRYNDARIALEKEGLGLSRDKLGEERRQFDGTMGLNRDKLSEETRRFDSEFGLKKDQFAKENETEQFGRARNARFAKVRAPLVTGLMAGRTLDKDPNVQARLGKIGGG